MEDEEKKICSRCGEDKILFNDFYMCLGKLRSECKKCTIARNAKYQRKKRPWKKRFIDGDETRDYHKEYYQNNKEKYKEYRRCFMAKNPHYYREYFRNKKNPQSSQRDD